MPVPESKFPKQQREFAKLRRIEALIKAYRGVCEIAAVPQQHFMHGSPLPSTGSPHRRDPSSGHAAWICTHPAHIRRVCLQRELDGRRRTLARVLFLWPVFNGEANVDTFYACRRARLRPAGYRSNQRYRCYWAPKNCSLCMKPLASYQAGCVWLEPSPAQHVSNLPAACVPTDSERVPPTTNSLARINSKGC